MSHDVLESRAIGAYLGLAIGDALGATVEFMTPREIRTHYGVHDTLCGGGWLGLAPGQVTDDTTMALALGRSVLAVGRVDARGAAEAFDDWMRRKPVDVGNTVRRGLVHFRHTGEVSVPVHEYDAGNGACMRTLPVALATYGQPTLNVLSACDAQAHVTHNNPMSDAGTRWVSLMVQDAMSGASRDDLLRGPARELVERFPPFRFRGVSQENPSAYIVETLRAVFQALFDTETFEDCLIDVVNRGGDADTTGAIAGMLAGAVYGVEAIPARWLNALDENIDAQCRSQAVALLALARGSTCDRTASAVTFG